MRTGTRNLLEKAALKTNASSMSEYVEKAIWAQLKKDGIK
jgi:hypothetical protein